MKKLLCCLFVVQIAYGQEKISGLEYLDVIENASKKLPAHWCGSYSIPQNKNGIIYAMIQSCPYGDQLVIFDVRTLTWKNISLPNLPDNKHRVVRKIADVFAGKEGYALLLLMTKEYTGTLTARNFYLWVPILADYSIDVEKMKEYKPAKR